MQPAYRRVPVRAIQNQHCPFSITQPDPAHKVIVRQCISQAPLNMDVKQNLIRRFSTDQENINPALHAKPQQEKQKPQLQQTIRWPIRMVTMNQPKVQVESAKAQVNRMTQPFGQSFVSNSIKQSIMISPKRNDTQSIEIVTTEVLNLNLYIHKLQFEQCINQKEEIIRSYQEKIERLENQIQNRNIHITETQLENEKKFKDFQTQIFQKLQSMEICLEKGDDVQLFLNELERKSNNLQTHINEEIQKAEDDNYRRKKEVQILSHNLKSNVWLRLDEDETYFKQELRSINNNLDQKIDKQRAEQQINTYVQSMQSELKLQIHQANELLEQASQTLQDGLKGKFVNQLNQIQQTLNERLVQLEQRYQQQQQALQNHEQEKRQLNQILTNLNKKFNQLKLDQDQKQSEFCQQIKQLEKEKSQLTILNEDYKKKFCAQAQTIKQLELELVKQNDTKHQLLSPIFQKTAKVETHSFCSNSTNVEIFKSNAQVKKSQQSNHQKSKVSPVDISLEDFADFNENSFTESCKSFEMQQTSNFNKKKAPFQDTFESPRRNPFLSSNLNLINKALDEVESTTVCPIDEIIKAIKRRLLYIDPSGNKIKTLKCTYSPGGHLTDKELGMYLLDDRGVPYKITKDQKEDLIKKKHILIS